MFPAVVPALGLGTLKATSALNQPFEGKIEILGATAEDFDSLNIKLADTTQFDRAGLVRGSALLGLKFEVVTNPNGNDYVRVYTREAVREPYLDFLIEMNWAQGKMVREYTVLLDPPLYDPNRRQPKAAAAAPAVRQAQAPAPSAARPPAARPAPTPAPAAAGGEIGPVQSGDTLWSIARRNLPGNGVSVHQMMIALLRANPQSFPSGNINLLRVGAILKLPTTEEIAAISRHDATAELGRQTQSWQEYRQGATKTTAPQQAQGAEVAPATPKAQSTKPTPEARLEIVSAAEKTGAAGTPGAVADESKVVAQADTTKELKARLDEAEEIIDLLKRQVEVKNDELARLQGQQVGAGAATPASEATKPATPPPAEAPKAEAPKAEAPKAEAPKAEAPPVAAETTPPKAAEPAPAPQPAKPAAAPNPAPKQVTPPPAASGGLEDLVPGGLMTLIGAAVSLLALGAFALRKRFGKSAGTPKAETPAVTAGFTPATAAADSTAAGVVLGGDTETPAAPTSHAGEEPGFNGETRTIEAPAESLLADPLEEVNVYLAYERFDQAEELVRKAIADHPGEPRYQHRLLEIFYFSNNLTAYEAAARDFRDMVGEDHEQWQSVVAMWEAMSPQRALFGAGTAAAATAAAVAATAPKEFVDITATAEPSAQEAMESTQVGLFGATTDNQAPPPADADDPLMNGMLDITAGEAEESEMLDLTATVEKLEQAGYLEHEEPAQAIDSETELFDISGSDGDIAGALDALEPEDADTQDPSDTVQLLDLSATGDLFKVSDGAKSDARALGLANTASGGGLATADAEFTSEVDFDVGELSDLNLDATSNPLDLGLDDPADADELDFDIGALGLGSETGVEISDQTVDIGSAIAAQAPAASTPVDLAAEDFSLDLDLPDFDAPAGAAAEQAPEMLDLTSELPEMLDLTTELPSDHAPAATAKAAPVDELDLDALNFGAEDNAMDLDLSLDETRELNDIFVDDPAPMTETAAGSVDPSMRDLTAELEASLAAFDTQDETAGDDFILDLTAADQDAAGGALDVDFAMDDGQTQDMSLAETVIRDDFDPNADLPANPDGGDEVDTKLNLAKAYIELGEKDAARSILLEAAREGTEKQQEEAGRLLAQVT